MVKTSRYRYCDKVTSTVSEFLADEFKQSQKFSHQNLSFFVHDKFYDREVCVQHRRVREKCERNKQVTWSRRQNTPRSSKNRKTITNFYFNLMNSRQWMVKKWRIRFLSFASNGIKVFSPKTVETSATTTTKERRRTRRNVFKLNFCIVLSQREFLVIIGCAYL